VERLGDSAMKVDCLMGTYGRYALACEALSCFLQQTLISDATLLIYNQHPTDHWRFDHPRVRIVNEPAPEGGLRHIRARMHELVDPAADLIHWWDDDDLYLPWHLEDCVRHVGTHAAWKPESSWMSVGNVEFSRHSNTFEGSWVFRADHLKSSPIDTHPEYTDHPIIFQTLESGALATTELGGRTSYIYRWGTGTEHLSGYGGNSDAAGQRERIRMWRSRSNDVSPDGVLVPADMSSRWRQYLDGTKSQTDAAEFEHNRRGVGL
jgi:hypothetical protein